MRLLAILAAVGLMFFAHADADACSKTCPKGSCSQGDCGTCPNGKKITPTCECKSDGTPLCYCPPCADDSRPPLKKPKQKPKGMKISKDDCKSDSDCKAGYRCVDTPFGKGCEKKPEPKRCKGAGNLCSVKQPCNEGCKCVYRGAKLKDGTKIGDCQQK